MINQVILPKLGTNIEDGVILEWRKCEGEKVKRGEVVLVVETAKAVFDVEAEYDGYLRKAFVKEGEEARFTEPVGLISDAPDEDISAHLKKKDTGKAGKRHHEKKREELFRPPRKTAPYARKVAATPAARRLSGELGIELAAVANAYGAEVVDESHVRSFACRKKVAIYGAGLGAKQALELLRSHPELDAIGLFDDKPGLEGEILGLKVLGGWEVFLKFVSRGVVEGVAVSLHSEYRRKLIEKIRKDAPSIELVPLVDRRAIVSEGVEISPGAFIEAGSVLGPDTHVGAGVIIDTGAVVSHDCHIGAHSHLSPGCVLSGIVRLEENVLVGVGASVNSQVTIGRNAVITPGSAVVSDLPDDVVASGNPAKIIGRSYRGA